MPYAQRHINGSLEPVGSLGRLEVPAIQLAGMPGSNGVPHVGKEAVLAIRADHGVWEKGVAILPKETTAIQAEDMARGTTGVCALTIQAGANVHVIDVGIDTAESIPGPINMHVTRGSDNVTSAPVMSCHQAEKLFLDVTCYTREPARDGATPFGAGELGMANTTPVAATVSITTGRDSEGAVGIGANLSTDKLANKIDVMCRVIMLNQPNPQDGADVLTKVGGFDLVEVAGMMLGVASRGPSVLPDGFPSYAAVLATYQISPAIRLYLILSHLSAKKEARATLSHSGPEPYLNTEMRLGEGNDTALAIPIIEAACVVYSDMGELAVSNIVLPRNVTSDSDS